MQAGVGTAHWPVSRGGSSCKPGLHLEEHNPCLEQGLAPLGVAGMDCSNIGGSQRIGENRDLHAVPGKGAKVIDACRAWDEIG